MSDNKKIKIPGIDKVMTNLLSIMDRIESELQTQKTSERRAVNGREESLTQESWAAYENFLHHLDTSTEEYKKTQINNFWRQYEVAKQDALNMLPWIDAEMLDLAKKKVLEHKDKQHTHCFDDLVLYKRTLQPDNFNIFDQLDAELPNFKDVTAFYRGSFALNRSREAKKYKAPKPILLLGNPGIGKTHYAKKLAQLLGTSYRFFDANSITGGWVLSGNNATWRGADAGLIFTEMAKSETMSPIILLDEIDKMGAKQEHSPFSTFHQLFEPENAKSFFDEFVNVSFDASQVIYILTANDERNIAPSLLSRMTVFHVDNPSVEDMRGICQNIYKTLMDGSTLFHKKLADSEVDKLVRFSPREVTQLLSNSIYNQASKSATIQANKTQKLIVKTDLKEAKKMGF